MVTYTALYAQTKDTINLKEVVVMGYGSGRDIDKSVGSTATVNSNKVKNRPTSNFLDALSGQVAGLSVITSSGAPNSLSSIRLRGYGSVNASNEPLFVIDGVPVDSRFALTFNPNDIESVVILKDASATSIYGSRGANGVICITTKQGSYYTRPSVSFSAGLSFASPVKPRLTPMTTEEHVGFMVDAGVIANASAETLLSLGNYDWQDLIYDNSAPTYQSSLSVSGGSNNSKYHFSTSYYDAQGVTAGSDMNKFTFRTGLSSDIREWATIGMNIALGHYKANNILSEVTDGLWFTDPIIGSIMIPSYQNPNDDEGNPLLLLPHTNYYPSPLTMPEMFPREERKLNVNGNIYLELTPIKNLLIRTMLGGNGYSYKQMNATSPLYPHAGGEGEITENISEYYSWVVTNSVEYDFNVDKHNFIVLLGHESIYNSLQSRELKTTGVTNDNFINIGAGLSSAVPVYNENISTFNSVFARIDYNFNDKYFLNLSLRNDASSRFSEANRNALFYSIGGMWRVAEEAFISDVEWVNSLNIRASYGTSGNAGIGDYEQYAMLSNVLYGDDSGWRLSSSGNSNLRWETHHLLNIGIEAKIFKKYHIGIEYYNRITKDMLLDTPISGTTGFTSQMKNAGSMLNRGVDIYIKAELYKNSDWSVNLTANLNCNKNIILELSNGSESYPEGESNILHVGAPYGTYYMQEWLGVDAATGNGMYNDGAGGVAYSALNAPPVMINKTWIAPYTGGLSLEVKYKKITFVTDATFSQGRYLWNRNRFFTENIMFASPSANQSTGILDYWKQEGDRATYPSLDWQKSDGGMQYLSSHTLEDASYFRLKNIQLAYDLSSSAKIWISGRNILTATKFKGFDPELDSSVATDNYPNSRQFTLGVELTF